MSPSETTQDATRRKTMMVGEGAHARIAALAETHDLKQYEVIEVLLDAIQPDVLQESVERVLSRRRAQRGEVVRKRQLLQAAARNLSTEELDALLATLMNQAPASEGE